MEAEKFMLDTENGQIECEVLMTLKLEEYQKNYLVYTDNAKDEEQQLNIFISSFEPEKENGELNDITDQQELETVSNYIEKIWEEENARKY